MPYLKIQLNSHISPEQGKQLLAAASGEIARQLGKPESYVMVELTTNPAMLFAGNDSPAAYLELKSIGLPAARTQPLSGALCGLLQERLGIDPARVYIEFTDVKGSCWGWNGSTF